MSTTALPVTVIEPRSPWRLLDVRELWRTRELLWFLTLRDIQVRYKQTIFGVAWAVLQPLATMAAFTLFLGQAAGVAEGITYPYSLFVFAGLLPWLFFASAVGSAGQSVVNNQNLVTKVYFPRLLIPFSAVGVSLLDFLIGFVLLGVLMALHGVAPGWESLWAPFVFLLLLTAVLGAGLLLSALTVSYRDFRFIVPFLLQLWMFATPSIYLDAPKVLSADVLTWLPLNPAYGLIVNFRAALLGGPLDYPSLVMSGIVSIALFVIGCWYFRRMERTFADII